ncbi:cofactor-independent phosphoglycerate mutase [mine drainage metagenome]|uniref:Cofactor-independent phosphoglycerate mutase n=1 Tax=mine drainage metagenome TaxID=410659 RepID=A0A1J5SH10_9ZZZZ
MQLHLVLPGLLWPQKALHDTAHDLDLPALSRLLGRGRPLWQPPLALEDWLSRAFGIAADETPAAALRLLGEGGSPGTDCWLCADPAHLAFEQGRLTLSGGELGITEGEMGELIAALTPHLAAHLPGFEAFTAGAPGHAYLKLTRAPQLRSTPPSAAIGRSLQWTSPRGPDAPAWLQLGNELQMLLHTLAANRERERLGQPGLNTLWLWGAGALPERRRCDYDAVMPSASQFDALLAGLAAWAGIAVCAPALAQLPRTGNTLLVCDALLAPAQELDANAWRERLAEVERTWLAPFAAALATGGIERLRLTALGEEACLDLQLQRSDLWKFWRKPRALHELPYPSEFMS